MTETNQHKGQNKLPFRKSHAFIIGIDKYQNLRSLRTAVNDATKLAEVLEREQGFNVHPLLLNATKEDIQVLLEKTIIEKVKAEDRCLFYFAGHGIAEEGEDRPEGYIIPVDAARGNTSSFISMKELYDAINKLPCKHLLVILDCCFAGAFKWSSRYRYPGIFIPKRIYRERFDRFVVDSAWQAITSSAYNQKAMDVLLENPLGKRDDKHMVHSPFAEALFKGLAGAADLVPAGEGDGLITASELYLYLREQVEPQTIEINERSRQTPGIFPLEKHDKGEYIFLSPNHILNLPPISRRNPYKGLKSFEEDDMDLFYGRERVIKDLIQKIDENNLLVVTGASGTGKSSVIKAGLIPQMRQLDYHILPVIRPGENPYSTLENALNTSEFFDIQISLKKIKSVSGRLIQKKAVLIIDQYEELITQCNKEDERNNFIEALKKLLDANQKDFFKIIITVRADFEPQLNNSLLKKFCKGARYTVPPFNTGELREIIEKPAVQEVLCFEPPKLIDRMINEVIQAPGALPLLSFVLAELFQLSLKKDRQRVLHEDDYKELGGVIGALHNCADNLYENLDAMEKSIMRKIMLRMISLEGGELAGKRVIKEELSYSNDNENILVDKVIGKLVEARLIVNDKDNNNIPFIEPAHDALIRGWIKLWEWIEDHGKDNILLQNRLGGAVKDYSTGKGPLWHDDPRLDLLKIDLESPNTWLNRYEKSFVKESIKLKRQKRNKFITFLVSVIIVLSVLSIFAIENARKANKEARIAKAGNFTSQAQLRLKDDPNVAIRLAEEAYYLNENNIARQLLIDAAAESFERPFYNVNISHEGPVNGAVFSPSGSMILTASSDNTAKLWDLQGNLLKEFKHNGEVYSAVFSPDSTKILTASGDETAKMWDLNGTLLTDFNMHTDVVICAVFSPDGSKILTASYDKTAKLWDLQGNLLKNFTGHTNDIKIALFSPDGSKIITASYDNTVIFWDLKNRLKKGFRYGNICKFLLFSPKGNRVLIGFYNNTVKLLDLQGNLLTDFNKQKEIIAFAAFSPDGNQIIKLYLDGKVKLWDLQGNPLKEFDTHTKAVNRVVFSPGGNRILVSSENNTVKLLDLQGNLLANLDKHQEMVTATVFSPDGTKILTTSRDKTAKLWDLKNQPVTNFIIHRDVVNSAVFSPDGSKILTASDDHTVKLWDLQGNLLIDFNPHLAPITSAVFSPDETKVLTASYDSTAKLWDMNGNPLRDFVRHTEFVNSAVFSPDGTQILTASADGTAKLWDLKGNVLTNININSGWRNSANFSPDGTQILTVSIVVKIWDLNGQPLAKIENKTDEKYERRLTGDDSFTSAVFSPNGNQVLTSSNDNAAGLWDLQGNLLTKFIGHKGIVYFAVFSPVGTRVLTASADGTAILWDLNGNLLANFNMHKGIVYSAVFSPDGIRILTASADKTAKLWYTPQGIIQWLKAGNIPQLAREENHLRGMEFLQY